MDIRISPPETFELSPASLGLVIEEYRLAPSTRWRRLAFGCENSCYLLESQDHCLVLRVTHQREPEELESEARFVSRIVDEGFSLVPAFLRNRCERYATQLPDGAAVIYDYISGSTVTSLVDPQLDALLSHLPSFFSATKATQDLNNFERDVFPSPSDVDARIEVCCNEFGLAMNLVRERFRIDELHLAEMQPLPCEQLIHGDLHSANFVWNSNQLAGIIDFDDCFKGHCVIELLALIRGVCFTGERLDLTRLRKVVAALSHETHLGVVRGDSLTSLLAYVCCYFFTALNKQRPQRKVDVINWRDLHRVSFIIEHTDEISNAFEDGITDSQTRAAL